MSEAREALLSGGCQCGAVRFACYAPPIDIGICHCRMCQKAVGGPFTSLAVIRREDFAWTRGTPKAFRSSTIAERDFCGDCGTPLTYRETRGPNIEVATGCFDEPVRVAPTSEVGTESKLAWIDAIARFPGKTTAENSGTATLARIVSYQHPDHDTGEDWSPLREKSRDR